MIKIKFEKGISERNTFMLDFYYAFGLHSFQIEFDSWISGDYGIFKISQIDEVEVGFFED